MSFEELLRGILSFDSKGWRPITSLLRALGIAIPLIGCFAIGRPAWGVLASLGALYTGTASFGGIHPVRVQRMLVASLATAAITGFACLINRGDAVAIGGVSCLAFFLALLGSLNPAANLVAIQAMGALIVVSGVPASSADPLGNALLVLAGGTFQTALLSLFGPINPFSVERFAVAAVYSGLADFVRQRGAEGAGEIPSSEPFLEAVARLEEAEFHGLRAEHLPLQHALSIAETLRACLVGYARSYDLLDRAKERPEGLGELNSRLALGLESIAKRIGSGDEPPSAWGFAENLPCPETVQGEFRYWLEMMNRELADLGNYKPTSPTPARRPSRIPRLQGLTGLFDSKFLQGVTLIHAVRYTLAIGLSMGAGRLSHVGHYYWFPLTVAFILRSDYATTLSRGAGRAVGTILGVGLASAIDVWLHPSVPVLIGLTVAAAWFAYAVYQANYTWYAFAITLFVVFSVSGTGLPEREIGAVRVFATLAGVLVALVVSFLWPMWQSREVRAVLSEAFAAQAAYGHGVEALLAGKEGADIEELRRRARSLRIEAQKLVAGASVEPKWSRRDHLTFSSDHLATLAEGAAEMLFVHAQAVGRGRSSVNGLSELRETLHRATVRAEENVTPA